MNTMEKNKSTSGLMLIKKCHVCGHLNESNKEVQKCGKCSKSFLPLNYFGKVHAKNSEDFKNLFASSDEIHESDLIKGIHALW